MKTVDAALTNAIRTGYAVQALPKLVAEWNMNRYYSPTVDNIPADEDESFDNEMFPIDSIVKANRPTKGVSKARIGESTVGNGYDDQRARYYIGSVDDVYQYWTSPVPTGASGNFPTHTDGITKVRPFVVYNASVKVNKIVIKVDNYWASPSTFYVRTTNVANPTSTDWSAAIATSPAIAADGTITLYYTGSSWSSTKPASMVNPPLATLRGIMLQVDSLGPGQDRLGRTSTYRQPSGDPSNPWTQKSTTGNNSFFNLIEISARREVDITDRLISVDDNFDMGEVSDLYPIGTLTSNNATLTLSNLYTDANGAQQNGYFNGNNANGPYAGLLNPNVTFNLEYIYTVGSSTYSVQQFKLYGGEWTGLVSDEVNIELGDFSKFFQETYPRPALYSDLTVSEIIQRVLDSVGFVDWTIENSSDTDHVIPNFWVNGEDNIWDVLNSIAKATQTAIYFDNFGKLRVKTRRQAFNKAKAPVWTLRAEKSGTELPDIQSLEQNDTVGANQITVTYKKTDWSKEIKGIPAMSQVWTPDTSSVVLRASALTRDISDTDTGFWIPQDDVAIWPYKGMAQIEGELVRFDGKQFVYYTYTENTAANGTVTYTNEQSNTVVVNSQDEYQKYNRKTPQQNRHKNNLTGKLMFDTEAEDGYRGVWNSQQRNHVTDINGWYAQRTTISGGTAIVHTNSAGVSQDKSESIMRISNPDNAGAKDQTTASHGSPGQDPYYYFGTKIKLEKGSGSDKTAGMIINHSSAKEDGYYVELKATPTINNTERQTRHELVLFTKNNGVLKQQGRGAPLLVMPNSEYEVDVQVIEQGSDHRIVVWVSGQKCLDKTISGSDKITMGGQFALYVRGKTTADFQYFYAIRKPVIGAEDRAANPEEDDSTFFNLKEGGFTGGFWDREWIWGWKTVTRRHKKKSSKHREKWKIAFFDEFGPIVHEVREYDVKFTATPVLHSRLYMSNEWSAICTEYRADPFSAHFVLANAARDNAIIFGEDSLVLGGGTEKPVNQILSVIGRLLVVEDGETVVAKDKDSIKMRGKVEAELESDWIQSKDMAKDISEWMKEHWSVGCDQLTVEVFGNPLIEVTDVVTIEYPEKFMTAATHKYFVTSIQTKFENGVNTTLDLRRVR